MRASIDWESCSRGCWGKRALHCSALPNAVGRGFLHCTVVLQYLATWEPLGGPCKVAQSKPSLFSVDLLCCLSFVPYHTAIPRERKVSPVVLSAYCRLGKRAVSSTYVPLVMVPLTSHDVCTVLTYRLPGKLGLRYGGGGQPSCCSVAKVRKSSFSDTIPYFLNTNPKKKRPFLWVGKTFSVVSCGG